MVAMQFEEDLSSSFGRYLGFFSPARKRTVSPKGTGPKINVCEANGNSPSIGSTSASEGACSDHESAAFDLADQLEQGLADEALSSQNVRLPLVSNKKLERCSIIYQEKEQEYRLLTEALDLLLIARYVAQNKRVEFFCPSESEASSASPVSSPTRAVEKKKMPTFTLNYYEDADEWYLLKPRCECCAHRPRHLTCEYMGKGQQVARIQHSRRTVGPGKAKVHNVNVHVPPLRGTQSTVWCPVWMGKDLGCRTPLTQSPLTPSSLSPNSRRLSEERLADLLPETEDECPVMCTRLPIWDPEVESLVLNFNDRCNLLSSARNFILQDKAGQEGKIIYQHAQIGRNTWCMDFTHPLSFVQAFAIAMSSLEWD